MYGSVANLVLTPEFATVHTHKALNYLQVQYPKHLIQVASPFTLALRALTAR